MTEFDITGRITIGQDLTPYDDTELRAALKALEARVAALEPRPPPTPAPDIDTVHIGPLLKVAGTLLGWTTVQETELSAATAAILEKCAAAKNQHAIGFGPSSPLQTVEGGPIDFTYHDRIYGYPTRKDGFFGENCVRVFTTYGCPPYMRVAKPGTAPMPTGAPTMGLYDPVPPHWSQVDNYAKYVAAFVDRYQIDVVQEHNENKGEWIGSTMPAGSVLVPPGSGLPQAPGGTTNRWAMEQHTYRFNKVYAAVKAVRPQCKVIGPYTVTRTYTDPNNTDSANDAFPKDLHGPWGNADWEAMRMVMYHLEHAAGIDAICLDTKTSSNDKSILPEYEWDGLQKIPDWIEWLDKLAAYDPAKYGRAKDAEVWFAEAYSRVIGGLTTGNHQRAAAIDAYSYVKYVLPNRVAGWMRWQTEGERGVADSAQAHSISLWHAKGSAKSLQPTEAVPVYAGLVEHFAPGTPLYTVTVDHPDVTGIASDKVLCLVSRTAIPVDVIYAGLVGTLAPYQVRFFAVPS